MCDTAGPVSVDSSRRTSAEDWRRVEDETGRGRLRAGQSNGVREEKQKIAAFPVESGGSLWLDGPLRGPWLPLGL